MIGAAGPDKWWPMLPAAPCGSTRCQGTPDDWPAARGSCDGQQRGRPIMARWRLFQAPPGNTTKTHFPGLRKAETGLNRLNGVRQGAGRQRLALRTATRSTRSPESGPSTGWCQAIGRERLRPWRSLNLACVRDGEAGSGEPRPSRTWPTACLLAFGYVWV